jgi:phage tail-like protein
MDANRQRFWMVADEAQWTLSSGVQYNRDSRRVSLLNSTPLAQVSGTPAPAMQAAANQRLALVPTAVDGFGTSATWDAARGAVIASGAVPGTIPIWRPVVGEQATDLIMGTDGVLYVAINGRVEMLDRRDRWDAVELSAPDFTPFRLAAHPSGGVWILDRTHKLLARVRGLPLPMRPNAVYSPSTFRPSQEDPDPPRLQLFKQGGGWFGLNEDPVAIASSPAGRLAVLTWRTDATAAVHQWTPDGAHVAPITLTGAHWPYSISWVSEDSLAVLVPDITTQAPVFQLTTGQPVGDIYPIRDYDGGPFLHVPSLPAAYGTTDGGIVPLHHLSLPGFTASGSAVLAKPVDSADTRTIWHRAYLEASIPPHCGIKLFFAATDRPTPPTADTEWHEHRFGDVYANAPDSHKIPRAAWVSTPSEVPQHPGLLGCVPERDRVGLFTVLIQRTNRPVSGLCGRYLWARVSLTGDTRSTPEIAALRVYGSRFSYVEKYLPELYHEDLFGPDADAVSTNGHTPSDFLERFLANFEGVLTPLEDRIASAYLLTDPATVPDKSIEWLASWIGLTFDPAIPADRRRAMLQNAPHLFRRHGTLSGLELGLNIATGGAIDRGAVRVLEDWRVRRTCATILGADLSDDSDPLLAGLTVSGNSYVGETLFVGDENRKEFLALFAPDVTRTLAEARAVSRFLDEFANRVTVLVHRDTPADEVGVIRRVVQLEIPAHVSARVLPASDAFLVGTQALVDIDSYLGPKVLPQPVQVGSSYLGVRDLVLGKPALDPRIEAAGSPLPADAWQPPVAAAGPVLAQFGRSFTIDGSASRASVGNRIIRYVWQFLGLN